MTIVKVKILGRDYELTHQFLADILHTALAGGIQYWCDVVSETTGENPALNKAEIMEEWSGGDSPEDRHHTVDIEVIRKGIERFLNDPPTVRYESNTSATYSQLYDWLMGAVEDPEDGIVMVDSEVADTVVQFGLFEDLVYG